MGPGGEVWMPQVGDHLFWVGDRVPVRERAPALSLPSEECLSRGLAL